MNTTMFRKVSRRILNSKSIKVSGIYRPDNYNNCNGIKSMSRTMSQFKNNSIDRYYTTTPNPQELYRTFKTRSFDSSKSDDDENYTPGSKAFADCESDAIQDLFFQFALDTNNGGVDDEGSYLSLRGVKELLNSIGEKPDKMTVKRLFEEADINGDGKLHLNVSIHEKE